MPEPDRPAPPPERIRVAGDRLGDAAHPDWRCARRLDNGLRQGRVEIDRRCSECRWERQDHGASDEIARIGGHRDGVVGVSDRYNCGGQAKHSIREFVGNGQSERAGAADKTS